MRFILIFVFSLLCLPSFSQIGIGTDNPEGALDIVSDSSGLIVSRVATVGAISTPVNGMVVYDISMACIRVFEDGFWTDCYTSSSVSSLDCMGASHSGILEAYGPSSGVYSDIAYLGGNGRDYDGQVISSTGVLGLTASLDAGTLAIGSGSLRYTITGTPSHAGTALFIYAFGDQVCTLSRPVILPIGSIASLDCAGSSQSGELRPYASANGVVNTIPYTGGNGGSYASASYSSTGVTGLVANLAAGALEVGSGSIEVSITGTPDGPGTASFTINVGGQSCVISRLVDYDNFDVVVSPLTGRTWMDRNLGASQVATSSSDNAGFGDLYQWGRNSDGHEKRNSTIRSGPVALGDAGSFFVTNSNPGPADWLQVSDDVRWNASGDDTAPVKTVHDPCPAGFRVPTIAEWRLEFPDTNGDIYGSFLKMPYANYRDKASGNLTGADTGWYWSSSVESGMSMFFYGSDMGTGDFYYQRPYGFSVRCIRE